MGGLTIDELSYVQTYGARIVSEGGVLLLSASLPEGDPLRRVSPADKPRAVFVWDEQQVSATELLAAIKQVRSEVGGGA